MADCCHWTQTLPTFDKHLQVLLAQQGWPCALTFPALCFANASAAPAQLPLPRCFAQRRHWPRASVPPPPFVTACPVPDAHCLSAPLAAVCLPSFSSILKSSTTSAAQVQQLPLPGSSVPLLCSSCSTNRNTIPTAVQVHQLPLPGFNCPLLCSSRPSNDSMLGYL